MKITFAGVVSAFMLTFGLSASALAGSEDVVVEGVV